MLTAIFSSFISLVLASFAQASLDLKVTKKIDDTFYPVTFNVEEYTGTTFALICELVTSDNRTEFDDNLNWIQDLPDQMNYVSDSNEINKSVKRFEPLQLKDQGKYLCVSHKFNLTKAVKVLTRSEVIRAPKSFRETIYCNEDMFQCVSNGLCIIPHYVCDGKPDCKDGSDESLEKCKGDPCRDKIPCDDGRCIPAAWCCDRHHDLNCTVTNRPRCCSGQSDPYEEMELGFPTQTHTQHTARYLFILVCVVSILFSVILLLLIISKVVMFAKKAALQQQQARVCENIALRNQTNINVIPYSLYTYRSGSSRTPRSGNIVRNIIIDSSDVNDPLLFNPARFNVINASGAFDQPPSYVDVLQNNRLAAEPPPPYRSQDRINISSVNTLERD